jgi:hypothetical protein
MLSRLLEKCGWMGEIKEIEIEEHRSLISAYTRLI